MSVHTSLNLSIFSFYFSLLHIHIHIYIYTYISLYTYPYTCKHTYAHTDICKHTYIRRAESNVHNCSRGVSLTFQSCTVEGNVVDLYILRKLFVCFCKIKGTKQTMY